VEALSPGDTPANWKKIAARIVWAALTLATLYVCYFTQLGIVGFVGPDEPRYASIARDMAETGDWITPRLYGQPWFEKPPLYYWSAALSFKLFGVSEISARLPSAFFALLATLAIAWLAWRVYDGETARWTLLLLPTSVGMVAFSHAAATDMPFSATLTVAMVAVAALLRLVPPQNAATSGAFSASCAISSSAVSSSVSESFAPSNLTTTVASNDFVAPAISSVYAVVFGVFLGLAMLAKGPAALILCGGAAFLWALWTKRWRDVLRPLGPAAIIAFCLTALPWYILCAYRNPDFFRVFIVEHNFKRFLTPEFQHIQPFWYYAGIILVAFLPWTAALLWALAAGLNRIRRASVSSSTILLLCWSVFCVAFFTISKSKLPGYILPAVPPIALLLARSCTFFAAEKRWSFALLSLAFSATCAATFVAVLRNPEGVLRNAAAFRPWIMLPLFLFAFVNLVLAIFVLLRGRSLALFGSVLPFLLAFWLFGALASFTPASILSPRYVADQVQAEKIPLQQLRFFKLKRATLYGVNFYLRSNLQEWDGDPAREVYVLTDGLHCSMKRAEMNCDNLWGDQERIEVLDVLHLTPKN
jgi:4-amino-4-deoxy-L-arabinose transferase-like glycosyltransferase